MTFQPIFLYKFLLHMTHTDIFFSWVSQHVGFPELYLYHLYYIVLLIFNVILLLINIYLELFIHIHIYFHIYLLYCAKLLTVAGAGAGTEEGACANPTSQSLDVLGKNQEAP